MARVEPVLTPSASSRDDAFDAVKGLLVAAMVLYHVMNMVTTASEGAYGYVRFVSGSFIFVTGLLLSRHVSVGFDRDPSGTARTLMLRGFKLLLLFTVLNLAIQVSGFGHAAKLRGASAFLAQAQAVYLRGDGRIASFVILLPISYLLMCAPLFLRAAGPARPAASVIVLIAALALGGLPHGGLGSSVVGFMVVGVAGLCAGALTRQLSPAQVRPTSALWSITGLVASIVLTAMLYFNLALYAVCVALVIHFMYACARHLTPESPLGRWLLMLGRYSLFGYIAQIVLIQLVARGLGHPQWPLGVPAAMFAALILAMLVVSCLVLQFGRRRFATIDRAYRWVFA
jgi:Acyltransferase family